MEVKNRRDGLGRQKRFGCVGLSNNAVVCVLGDAVVAD